MLKLITITEEWKAYFDTLIPEELFCKLDQKERFAIGVLEEEQGKQYSAGILLFKVSESKYDGLFLPELVVEWIYVDEAYRGRGIADAMMEKLSAVLDRSAITFVKCEVPREEQYDDLCAFLETWNFEFTVAESHRSSVSLKDIKELPVFEKEIGFGEVCTLNSFPKLQGKYPDEIDSDISGVLQNDGKAEGTFLVGCKSDRHLEIKSLSGGRQGIIGAVQLFLHGMREAVKKYEDTTLVEFDLDNETVRELIKHLFGEFPTEIVRLGTCRKNS